MDIILKKNKGITLIALVITIVILIILAAVAINTVLGENGILARAKQAALEHKKAQYYEEINIEIIEEQMERQTSHSDTPFIVSLKNRLYGTEQASNESVSTHSRKSWVKNVIMCDNHMNENKDDLSKNTVLIIETTEDYEIFVHVNNSACTATIDTDSFGKVEEPCAIHFNLNGGTGSISDTSIRKNFTVSMPSEIPTRTNYTFGGWCQSQDGSTKIYSAGSASDPITEETTFYAIWTLNAVTLSFDSNGGSGSMNPVPIIINTPTAISEMTFTEPDGYTFDKWTTNIDGTGDSYSDLDEITISVDTTLYAQWKDGTPPTVTISTLTNSSTYLFAISAQVSITDSISSVDYSKCKYVFTTTNTPIGTDLSNYTDGTIDSTGVIEKAKGAQTYYLHVLATDSEGNSSETVSPSTVTVASIENYPYNTNKTNYTASLLPGTYKFECWGAQGGDANNSRSYGGKGGYTSGNLSLTQTRNMYIYVGEHKTELRSAAFNCGSTGGENIDVGGFYSGGGATDIRLVNGNWDDFDSLKSRIMVAAGGGAATDYNAPANGGYAGGLTGGPGFNGKYSSGSAHTPPQGATQTTGGVLAVGGNYSPNNGNGYLGTFGKGGNGNPSYGSGGGGGYYGGTGGSVSHCSVDSGSGGSSFISGYTGCNAISESSTASSITHTDSPNHYSQLLFTSAVMKAGNETLTSPTGTDETGHTGNGYARITNMN